MNLKPLQEPVGAEPPRRGDRQEQCSSCHTPDSAYLWTDERWRLKSPPSPSGLPVVVILEPRAHLDLGDLSTMHAAELGVLTVRLERAIRSLESVAQVHVNRWGDGTAHLQMWFLARPKGYLQLRGPFMTMWDEILPAVDEHEWRMNLEYISAWLSDDLDRTLVESRDASGLDVSRETARFLRTTCGYRRRGACLVGPAT